jgi:hypothetical protein
MATAIGGRRGHKSAPAANNLLHICNVLIDFRNVYCDWRNAGLPGTYAVTPKRRANGDEEQAAPPAHQVHQDVTDISKPSQLLRYALAGQLERLRQTRPDLRQARIAHAAELRPGPRNSEAALSHALHDGPSTEQLGKLDVIIGALSPELDGTGGLSSLNLRLSTEGTSPIVAHVPTGWTGPPVKDHGRSSELEVLAQASALLSAFAAAERVDDRSVDAVRKHYEPELELLVRRLILISVSPPTSRNYDAQIMLGSLASYALEPMKDWLDNAVRYWPLAFRAWRAITKLVKLRRDGDLSSELRGWVQQLLSEAAELRTYSLYPGRSLDLELALVVPASSSPSRNDWVGEALRTRAWDKEATIRERGTAAMGLWQRAIEQDRDLAAAEKDLRELITEFRDPESRPDAAAGLRWIAQTLEYVIDNKVAVCNQLPRIEEPWFTHVEEAASQLDKLSIADHLVLGTKNLFMNMILQNAGVYRRQAIETVVTAGMTNPIAQALGYLLRNEPNEAWLRIRAEFALGFLQRANHHVEDDLVRACTSAYRNLGLKGLAETEKPPRSQITEVHASLFAVGDCFGVAGVEDRARSARERLRGILTDLAEATGERARIMRRAARAAAYLLTVTAQDREGTQPDLSEVLLDKLKGHPDEVTARLSRWALSFRFAPDGTVRPLLDAAVYGRIENRGFDNPD